MCCKVKGAVKDFEKTKFTCNYGFYQHLCMLFGLRKEPGMILKSMNVFFSKEERQFVLLYLTETVIFLKT